MTGLIPFGWTCTAWQYAQARGMRVYDHSFLVQFGKRAAQLARRHGVREFRVQEGQHQVFSWPEWVWEMSWDVFESPQERYFWDAHIRLAQPDLMGLIPQYPVVIYDVSSRRARYRLDFAIPGRKGGIAIEIDGFDNHSSRDDQVRDNQRQRDISRNGWFPVRYAGRETNSDAAWCVMDAARQARQWRRRMYDF